MSTMLASFDPPQTIGRKVARLRRAVRAYVATEGLARLAILTGLAFWGALALDWTFEPRPAVRAVFGLMLAGALLLAAWRWLIWRAAAPLPGKSLALLVERAFPRLNDGLITTVEATASGGDAHWTPARRQMLSVTAQRTAANPREVNLGRLFNCRPLTVQAVAALALLGSIGLFAWLAPEAMAIWQRRMQLSPEPWPRRVSLTVVGFEDRDPNLPVNVARDDAYQLEVLASIVDGHQVPADVEVRWRMADGRRGRGSMVRIGQAEPGRDESQLFHFPIKVSTDVVFDVIGGDDRVRGLRLRAVERPTIKAMSVRCEYPAYMQRAPREIAVSSGRIELPIGATAICRAESNKPLRSAKVLEASEQMATTVELDSGDPSAFSFSLSQIAVDRTLLMTMRDVDGVQNREPFRLQVVAVPDEPPEVNVQLRGIGTAVTPQARIPWAGRLSDDYALVDAWFEYGIDESPPHARMLRAQPTGLASVRLTEAFDLTDSDPATGEPLAKVVPGNRLVLRVVARDAYDLGDGPHEGASPRFVLDVVTPSELRSRLERRELGLRQRFEAIYDKMQGVRDLLQRIDLVANDSGADDGSPAEGSEAPPANRNRQLVRLAGLRQSATQLAFETTGVAEGIDDVLAELINNRVDTEELRQRLEQGIAEPLKAIGGEMLPRLDERLGAVETLQTADSPETLAMLATAQGESHEIVDAMQAVLDRMLELESYNELVEILRGIVAEQQALRDETLRRQRERLEDLLDD
ncbi:MAG TPA: hypothetical protein PJ982_14785 [Lacipirellulaceae bacterium]|nr:hypothetical protein [Lacipirellulaceae bacterium]